MLAQLLLNSIHNGVYPGHYRYLCLLIGIATAVHFNGYNVPLNLTNRLLHLLPGSSLLWQMAACILTSLFYWLTAIYMLRYILKLLLMYKGWMYESRARGSQVSLKTKIWFSLLKIFSGWNTPKLYSYQGSLPRLPLPSLQDTMERNQAARAASSIYSVLVFRRLIERQELEPIRIQGVVPLCSWQYERTFNTTRIPGIETDKICHWSDSNHIIVYHKGRYFKVIIYKGRILKPCELQVQMQQILDDKSTPLPLEEQVAVLTAAERTHWAQVRRKHFNRGVNKVSLDAIEKAAFFVTLDNFPYEFDMVSTHINCKAYSKRYFVFK
ncbi:unnamed protein product [Acanthoscelides obtectus]|uniref:Choline/carnitine acyltransferase domain-containing protein n=1 Tax=Acanthoscelides obtectus TaxID=200917 RepID=A0A9P0PLS3_ACAOB|nr:unnamed protein product [Acanthoscelides obtectus]CAK1638827.1 Carnitine O-palmitoyltransferase 1, liver isoform [Acanthoscelides obtectus]